VVAAGLYNVYREQVRRAAERAGAFSSQANSLGDSENATKNTIKEGA
jgi:hypothetical protein